MTEHQYKIKQLKTRMLEVAYKNQQGFLPSSFSILDILVSLYYEVMAYDSKRKEYIDTFVLSKGHAALALYAILEDKSIIDKNELESWGKYKSRLCLMADGRTPGVLFSTGSLGHGLPEAVGLAYGKKVRNIKGKVFVLVGDGEMNEGSNWEAVQVASRLKLDNLVCIIDNNNSSLFTQEKRSLKEKLEAFGWLVEKADGHSEQELTKALNRNGDTAVMVIAGTVKGKGCAAMEANPSLWHAKAPNELEYKSMLEEVLSYD